MHIPLWNAETIGYWGIIVLTIVEGWGLYGQIRGIWRQRSGQSVSVGMTLFLLTMFMSAMLYGTTYHRPPLVFNGLVLGLGFGIIAIGLSKFKGFKDWEYWSGLALLASFMAMVLTGHHDRWYFLYAVGSAIGLALQPWEIWRNRDAGVVDIRLLILFEVSNLFWVIYGFAVHDWVLMTLCPVYIMILAAAIILWWIYRRK